MKKTKEFKYPTALFCLFGISAFFEWEFHFELELLDAYPYRENGEIPMIFINFGPFEFIFENEFIYDYLYKRKHGIKIDRS